MLKAVQQPSTRMLIVYCQHHHQALHTSCCARLDVDSGHSVEGGGANARCVTLLTKVMREAVSGAGVDAGNTRCWSRRRTRGRAGLHTPH